MAREQIEHSAIHAKKPADYADEIAARIVALLRDHADGQPLDSDRTLQAVAERLACRVVRDVSGGSSYASVNTPRWSGVIRLDVAQSPDDIVRDLAHELAHHILHTYAIQVRFAAHLDLHLIEETICRNVAQIVKALPAGLLWNGKLAPPLGDGTIRVFKRLNVRVPSQDIPPEEWDELEG